MNNFLALMNHSEVNTNAQWHHPCIYSCSSCFHFWFLVWHRAGFFLEKRGSNYGTKETHLPMSNQNRKRHYLPARVLVKVCSSIDTVGPCVPYHQDMIWLEKHLFLIFFTLDSSRATSSKWHDAIAVFMTGMIIPQRNAMAEECWRVVYFCFKA